MMGFVLLLSSLALLGAGGVWWRRRRAADSSPTRLVTAAVSRALELLPEGGNGEGESGLAVFYAYQMAASKIDRVRGG